MYILINKSLKNGMILHNTHAIHINVRSLRKAFITQIIIRKMLPLKISDKNVLKSIRMKAKAEKNAVNQKYAIFAQSLLYIST